MLNVNRLHFVRKTTGVAYDADLGLVLRGVPTCGGNSGGPLMDESACVLYGVLSSGRNDCPGNLNEAHWSRITNENVATTDGVAVRALAAAVTPGQSIILGPNP